MDIAKQLRVTLGPAIDAARAALRDLDADDVPSRLRPVARRGDGTLPIPLVKTLLRGIDQDEWFRSKVIEAFERAGTDDAVSEAYLRSEPEWWMVVVDDAVTRAVAGEEQRLARALADLDVARDKLHAEKSKVKSLKKELSHAEGAAKATIETRLEPAKVAASEARADAVRAESRVAALEAELERRQEEEEHAQRSAANVAEELRSARKAIADLRREAESGASESMPRDPVDVARWLDRTRVAVNPFREAVSASRVGQSSDGREKWCPPAGVAPDSREAVEALAGIDGFVVLVDGHNLLGVLDTSTMATGRARKELVVSLGRLERHLGDGRVDIVFDSDLRDGRPISIADSGIVVRFAEEALLADDVLVHLAAELGASAIVVSDDREVRERCSAHGAAVLWAKALADWL